MMPVPKVTGLDVAFGGIWCESAACNDLAAAEIKRLRSALQRMAYFYDLNDCAERDQEGNLEIPLTDLRACKDALSGGDAT